MSLKAYDGMMTRKGLPYIQTEIQKRMDKFTELSIDKIAEAHAKLLVEYLDKGKREKPFKAWFELYANGDRKVIEEIENVSKDCTVISYMFQMSKIMANGYFLNDYVHHLHLTLEAKDDKILVYPNLMVPEHRKVLLEFLDDWYAQNQCDPDEKVPEDEWKERCDDWWKFNETKHYQHKITLFDPSSWDSLTNSFRGDELFDAILSKINDEKRIKTIHYDGFMTKCMENPDIIGDEEGFSRFWKARDYLNTDEGKAAYEKYKEETQVELIPINKELLESHLSTIDNTAITEKEND